MQSEMPPATVPPADPQATMHRLRLLRQGIAIGLMAFSLLLLLLSLFLIAASVRKDVARSEANLGVAQARLLRLSTPAPAVQALMTTLSTTLSLADQLEAVRPPVGIDWPAVVTTLASYDPNAITLTSLTQLDNRITLTGQAVNDVVVVDYAHALEGSPLFANVVLQSLALLDPATPAAPVAPGTVNFVIVIELSGQTS